VNLESKPRDFESLDSTKFVCIRHYIQANPECSNCKKALLRLSIKQRGLEGRRGFSLEWASADINNSRS
jgi:hypothetical protein